MLLLLHKKWRVGIRHHTKGVRAENDVFSVVRLWIREKVECYGGDVGGRDNGKFAFARGGVDLAFAADVGEVLAFGEVFWRKSVS